MDIKDIDPNFSQRYKVKDKRQWQKFKYMKFCLNIRLFFFTVRLMITETIAQRGCEVSILEDS